VRDQSQRSGRVTIRLPERLVDAWAWPKDDQPGDEGERENFHRVGAPPRMRRARVILLEFAFPMSAFFDSAISPPEKDRDDNDGNLNHRRRHIEGMV
jgi:hypothetical protein